MDDPLAAWAIETIRERGASAFYSSYAWQRTAAEVREAQHNECQRCKAAGWYAPAQTVHHSRPLLDAPELALDKTNLICLCADCHNEIHGRSPKPLNLERW